MKIYVHKVSQFGQKITVRRNPITRKAIGFYTYKPKACSDFNHIANCDCDMEFDRQRDINLTEVEL